MALDPTEVFLGISNEVKRIVGSTGVFVSEQPPDESLPRDATGTLLPYVALYFGGPVRAATDRSLVTTRKDSQILYLTVEVVAPVQEVAMRLKGKLLEELTGFKEGDMSELTVSGLSMSASRASNKIRPTQYIEMQSWQCRSNLSTR